MKKHLKVVGGGVMGLGIARELAGAGWQVTLYEKNARLGDESSRAAAGMIGPQSEALEDDAYFAATLASRDLWPDYAAGLSRECGLDFGFKDCGALHLAFGAAYEARLEAKYLWQKRRAGRLERLDLAALREIYPHFHPRVSSAFLAHGDYWVDNELLCEALEKSCRARGVDIRLGEELVPGADQDGPLLLAAGAWSSRLFQALPGVHPVKGQMLSFRVPSRLLPPMPVHAEFCYLVPRGRDRILVGATVETVGFDKRLTGEGIEWLLQNAFESIPDLRNCEVEKIWSGLRPGAGDGWPTLGLSSQKNIYVATGHYRRGLLFLPLSCKAMLQCLEQGSLPAEARAFSFARHSPAAHAV